MTERKDSPLVGFETKMRTTARCHKGHEYAIDAVTVIGPCKFEDLPKYYDSVMAHIQMSFKELEAVDCELCKEAKNTKWLPFGGYLND